MFCILTTALKYTMETLYSKEVSETFDVFRIIRFLR